MSETMAANLLPAEAMPHIEAYGQATSDAERSKSTREIYGLANHSDTQGEIAVALSEKLFELAGKFEQAVNRKDLRSAATRGILEVARGTAPAQAVPLYERTFALAGQFEDASDRKEVRSTSTREIFRAARNSGDPVQAVALYERTFALAGQFEDASDRKEVRSTSTREIIRIARNDSGQAVALSQRLTILADQFEDAADQVEVKSVAADLAKRAPGGTSGLVADGSTPGASSRIAQRAMKM